MDSYGLTQVSTPGAEPIMLDEAAAHLRIVIDESDELGRQEADQVRLLIKAARKFFEKSTGQAYTIQTWVLSLDHFPNYLGMETHNYERLWDFTGIRLPKSPPIARGEVVINAVTYIDTAGGLQTLAGTEYQIDYSTLPIRIVPAYGKIWPVARYQPSAVRINFTATPEVDEDVKAGMLLLLSHWNEHREAVLAGIYTEVPLGVQSIISLNWDGAYGGKAG